MTAALRQTLLVDLNQGAMDVIQTRKVSLARNEAPLHGQESGELQTQWRNRDQDLSGMDGQLRSVPSRSGTGAKPLKLAGAQGCSGRLPAGELFLDYTARADVAPGRCAQSALAESIDASNAGCRNPGQALTADNQAPGGMQPEHGKPTGKDAVETGNLADPQRRIVATGDLEQTPGYRPDNLVREGQARSATRAGATQRDIAPRQPGRTKGSFSPLTIWLRGVIRELRRENFTCRQVFYRIGVAEEMDDDEQSFTVTAETSDFVWLDCCGDIAGKRVTWENFRKLWQKI
ncbi:MAG: hypothetical protein ABTQ26_11830 [Azonexus sp.]